MREELTAQDIDQHVAITKLDKIIRGTVLVEWLHRLAVAFFILFTAIFLYLLYPDAKAMVVTSAIAACGYVVSLIGVFIQLKLYHYTVGKIGATVEV